MFEIVVLEWLMCCLVKNALHRYDQMLFENYNYSVTLAVFIKYNIQHFLLHDDELKHFIKDFISTNMKRFPCNDVNAYKGFNFHI